MKRDSDCSAFPAYEKEQRLPPIGVVNPKVKPPHAHSPAVHEVTAGKGVFRAIVEFSAPINKLVGVPPMGVRQNSLALVSIFGERLVSALLPLLTGWLPVKRTNR